MHNLCFNLTAEEAHNPQRSIPLSTMATVFFVFLSFFGVSLVLTMMCPYYLLDARAPLPMAFERIGWTFAKYVVTVGGIVGLLTRYVLGVFFFEKDLVVRRSY